MKKKETPPASHEFFKDEVHELQPWVEKNLDKLEPGLKLNKSQVHLGHGIGRPDIFAEDAEGKGVIIELKIGKVHTLSVLEQVLRYYDAMTAGKKQYRIMIVGEEFEDQLKSYAKYFTMPIELFKVTKGSPTVVEKVGHIDSAYALEEHRQQTTVTEILDSITNPKLKELWKIIEGDTRAYGYYVTKGDLANTLMFRADEYMPMFRIDIESDHLFVAESEVVIKTEGDWRKEFDLLKSELRIDLLFFLSKGGKIIDFYPKSISSKFEHITNLIKSRSLNLEPLEKLAYSSILSGNGTFLGDVVFCTDYAEFFIQNSATNSEEKIIIIDSKTIDYESDIKIHLLPYGENLSIKNTSKDVQQVISWAKKTGLIVPSKLHYGYNFIGLNEGFFFKIGIFEEVETIELYVSEEGKWILKYKKNKKTSKLEYGSTDLVISSYKDMVKNFQRKSIKKLKNTLNSKTKQNFEQLQKYLSRHGYTLVEFFDLQTNEFYIRGPKGDEIRIMVKKDGIFIVEDDEYSGLTPVTNGELYHKIKTTFGVLE